MSIHPDMALLGDFDLFLVRQRRFAVLADLDLLTVYFLFIQNFNRLTLADGAETSAVRSGFPQTLTPVGFRH
jgi:hypothetical protein